jgi:hypothetical protein
MNKASAAARAKMQERLGDLEKQTIAAHQMLQELKSASSRAWADLKSGMSAAMEDFKKSYKHALSHFD